LNQTGANLLECGVIPGRRIRRKDNLVPFIL
jgi:hypothetical protein